MQNGPKHCNVGSGGVSVVDVVDVVDVVGVVFGNAWPACAAAVDALSLSTVALPELEKEMRNKEEFKQEKKKCGKKLAKKRVK